MTDPFTVASGVLERLGVEASMLRGDIMATLAQAEAGYRALLAEFGIEGEAAESETAQWMGELLDVAGRIIEEVRACDVT